MRGIYVSTGSACNSKNIEMSHVLRAISLDGDYANGTIRISLGKNNTIEEVELLSMMLIEVVNQLLL